MSATEDAARGLDGLRRLHEFQIKRGEQDLAALHGELATARGLLGMVERKIREKERELSEHRAALKELVDRR